MCQLYRKIEKYPGAKSMKHLDMKSEVIGSFLMQHDQEALQSFLGQFGHQNAPSVTKLPAGNILCTVYV